jgi:hypothetical protein
VKSLVCPFFARHSAESSGLRAEWDAAFNPRPHSGAVLRVRGGALTPGSETVLEGTRRKVEIGKAFILPNQVGFGQRAGNGSCHAASVPSFNLNRLLRNKAKAPGTSKKR